MTKKARRHRQSLSGSGFYGSKFSELQGSAVLAFQELKKTTSNAQEAAVQNAMSEIEQHIHTFFDPGTSSSLRGQARKRIAFLMNTVIEPVLSHPAFHAPSDELLPLEIVRPTRGYVERIAEQAAGSYDQGWYDASAVMARRLLETLIIETFEAYSISHKIKAGDGSFFQLRDLIGALLKEPSWNIGRTAQKALPQLKDLGDQSAHNRRYIAKKPDLDKIKREFRITIEELVHLSKLKK